MRESGEFSRDERAGRPRTVAQRLVSHEERVLWLQAFRQWLFEAQMHRDAIADGRLALPADLRECVEQATRYADELCEVIGRR